MKLFHYLHYGLSLILVFIGAKLLLSDIYKLDMVYALVVVATILAGSVLLSILLPKKEAEEPNVVIKESEKHQQD